MGLMASTCSRDLHRRKRREKIFVGSCSRGHLDLHYLTAQKGSKGIKMTCGTRRYSLRQVMGVVEGGELVLYLFHWDSVPQKYPPHPYEIVPGVVLLGSFVYFVHKVLIHIGSHVVRAEFVQSLQDYYCS